MLRKPITGILVSCARAGSGQDTAALPRKVINSRRFMTDPLLTFLASGPRAADYHTIQMRTPCLDAGHLVLVSFDGTSVLLLCKFSGTAACPRDYDSSNHERTLTRFPLERP